MKTFLTLSFALALHSLTNAQNIPDSTFAQAIRLTCSACIDANNNLTANADTLTYLDVSGRQINDLSGVVGFDNLQTLIADYNPIDSLPALPASLRKLSALLSDLRNIDNVSNLPNLEYLDVGYAQLTALPALPNTIQELRAYRNEISQITNLPTQARFIDISYNRLTNLLPLGNNLTYLDISYNQFDSLTIIGGDNLDSLLAFNNSLDYINDLPNRLKYLDISENLFTTLPPLPLSLVELKANYNLISGINRLNQLWGLINLELIQNQLTALPNLPANLKYLFVNGNNLTSLPAMPPVLRTLEFGNNQVNQWPALNDSLITLYAANNQLSYIDYLPPYLSELYIDDNPQLNCLPAIPNFLFYLTATNTNITCLPNAIPIQVTLLQLPVCNSTNNPNSCLELSVNNTPSPTFTISPNPCKDYITVQNSELLDNNSQLYLYNNLGQLVKNQTVNINNPTIDVADLQPAVYYLMIKTANGNYSQKMVKE